MREPLLLPAAAVAAGIALSRFVAFESRELLYLICTFVFLALVAWWRSLRAVGRVCWVFALLFTGVFLEIFHRPGPLPELEATPREILIFSGCVVEPPIFFEDREQFVLELAPEARVRMTLYPREGEPAPDLQYGQRVEVEARVSRPHNFGNPGSFDYVAYLARQHIYWTAFAKPGSRVRILKGRCGTPFWRAVFSVRSKALERLEQLYRGRTYETAMTQAILIGEKSRLERVWTDSFRFTGTYHALVISGLHLAVIAGIVLFLLRIFLLPDGAVFIVATAFAWLYAVVTGLHPPVVRAASGLTLFLAARYCYRRRYLLNLLAAVALGFLIFDPVQLFEASFQLSFLSVIAIAALAIPLLERTSVPRVRGLRGLDDSDRDLHLQPHVAEFRVELRLLAEAVFLWTRISQRWILRAITFLLRIVFYVYELLVVSAAVQIGLALPMAVYFHRVSFSGFSANVVVVPLISLIVPAGFLAIFTTWSIPAMFVGQLLEVTHKVVEWHAQREPVWRIPDPPVWLAISFSLSLILLAISMRGAARWRKPVFALVGVLFLLLLWLPSSPEVRTGTLEITAIDVGQGDSIFAAFPDGKLAIIDGGGSPSYGRKKKSRFDVGEDVVSPYLWSRSIRRLDIVVMSHAHEDHMLGLFSVIDNFQPRELWTGAVPETEAWASLREKARERGTAIRSLAGGQKFDWGGAHIEVLTPLDGYSPAGEARDKDSLVLRLSFGTRSILLTGDMDRQMEAALIDRHQLKRTDVLKVAHHGSKTSTSEAFLEIVRPAFAVVSAGFENPYNHPHPEVVRRLQDNHAAVLRTDLWGQVTIRTDGKRVELNTARWSGTPRRLLGVF